jgi:hypothetical protein
MSGAEVKLMDEKFKGLAELMNAHFHNVDDRLDKIEKQTTLTNGRVTELEKKEIGHIINCPQAAKVRKLEDTQLSSQTIRKWVVTSIGVAVGLTGIVFTVIKFFWG